MFREQPDQLTVWTPGPSNAFVPHELTPEATLRMEQILPMPFEIDSDVALPNSVPFSFLESGGEAPVATYSRSMIETLLGALSAVRPILGGGTAAVQQNARAVVDALGGLAEPMSSRLGPNELKSLELGRDLLLTLGQIDPNSLMELSRGIDQQHDGYVGGLLEGVNQQLERKLNFRLYWVQDRDFSLRVTTRDRELVFVISDRTGTVYTFSERSSGLRYFLSYLIQAQIHRPSAGRESILLMDEPDTYLSAEAQQDLMRVFRDLAEPEEGIEPIQVVYVTHSPFLLDGSRVVPNVSRNHYEPLRSAFGAFVGESAFVGSVNLLVEGAADQIILAGAANMTRLRSPGVMEETLDLNRMMIVPSGSVQEIGYTVYRIRGQGADKPPVVALLDGDVEGVEAGRAFAADKRLRKLIAPENILNLERLGAGVDGWPGSPAIEDLVPVPLAHRAMQAVIEDVTKFREGDPCPARSEHYNYAKHADKDPEKVLEFRFDAVVMAIFEACVDYGEVFKTHTYPMVLIKAWMLASKPEFLKDTSDHVLGAALKAFPKGAADAKMLHEMYATYDRHRAEIVTGMDEATRKAVEV